MSQLLQLKVTLRHVSPPIWRRVEVPDSLTFWDLHFVLQILFDWQNSHLFEFRQGRGTPDEFLAGTPSVGPADDMMPEWQQDPRDVTLDEVLTAAKQKLTYVYDFGDYWEHDIVVEKALSLPDAHPVPAVRCLTGRRASPPEDIGGWPGYEQLVDVLAEKAAGKRKRLPSHFAGLGKFDPEEFDLASFNHDLLLLPQIVAEENAILAFYTEQQAANPSAPRPAIDINQLLDRMTAMLPPEQQPVKKKPKK